MKSINKILMRFTSTININPLHLKLKGRNNASQVKYHGWTVGENKRNRKNIK